MPYRGYILIPLQAAGWSVGRSVGRLVGRLVSRLVGRLVGWSSISRPIIRAPMLWEVSLQKG
jgi:hypothetical protein